jgi:hypothetical protein
VPQVGNRGSGTIVLTPLKPDAEVARAITFTASETGFNGSFTATVTDGTGQMLVFPSSAVYSGSPVTFTLAGLVAGKAQVVVSDGTPADNVTSNVIVMALNPDTTLLTLPASATALDGDPGAVVAVPDLAASGYLGASAVDFGPGFFTSPIPAPPTVPGMVALDELVLSTFTPAVQEGSTLVYTAGSGAARNFRKPVEGVYLPSVPGMPAVAGITLGKWNVNPSPSSCVQPAALTMTCTLTLGSAFDAFSFPVGATSGLVIYGTFEQPIVLSPATGTFAGVGAPLEQTVAATEVAYSGRFTFSSQAPHACKGIVQVDPARSNATMLALVPVSVGLCSYTVRDAYGETATLPISVTTTVVTGS